jgi:hypothetical protein
MTKDDVTVTITEPGTTFRIVDYRAFSLPLTWKKGQLMPNTGSTLPFIADFSKGLSAFEIQATDWAGDDDWVYAEGYDGANGTGNLLVSTSAFWPIVNSAPNYVGLTIYAPTGTAMQSVKFYSIGSAQAMNMIWDNMAVETVPEPATLVAIGTGICFLIARKRKA